MTTAHFIPTEQFVSVECDLKDDAGELLYPGLWIEGRTNLTTSERSRLLDALDAIQDRLQDTFDALFARAEELDRQIERVTPSGGDDADEPGDHRAELRSLKQQQRSLMAEQRAAVELAWLDRLAVLAPHIRAWNIYQADESPLEPPATGGAQVLRDIFPDLSSWMMARFLDRYRAGQPVSRSASSGQEGDAATPEELAGPQVAGEPRPKRSTKGPRPA